MSATTTTSTSTDVNQIHVLYQEEKQKNPLVESLTSSSFTGNLNFTTIAAYKGTTSTDAFNPQQYYTHLKTETLGRTLLYSERVTSTQTILNDQLTHAPTGTIVLADHQVTGKGRGSNIWESPKGCLMFSIKFHTINANLLPFVQYLISLEMVRAIAPHVDIRIKWPNDLYTSDGVKIGGILCQSSFMERTFDIVVGIGINVANASPTTCLNSLYRSKHGQDAVIPFTRESIVANFVNLLEKDLVTFEKDGFTSFQQEYLKYWLHSNQRVTIAPDNREVVITGLAPSGFLQASDVNDSTKHMELHPDGNSFDFLKGLIVQKEWKAETTTATAHKCENC